MKRFSLIFLIALFGFSLAITSKAQISIQSTNFTLSATAKDSVMGKLVSRTGVILPTQGNNQTWDYSALRDSLPNEYYFGYITQPVTARPPAFASASLEANYFFNFQNFPIPVRNFYVNNTTGYGVLGDSILFSRYSLQTLTGNPADSLTYPAQSRIFNAISYIYKYPMTANSSWASTNKYVTNFLLKIVGFGVNNTPGQQVRTTFLKDTMVGWGTLRLRNPANGTVLNFNVLLNQHTYTSIDSFFLGGQPGPVALLNAFGVVQGARDTAISYSFIGLNSKGFHFRIIADKKNSSVTNVWRAILPNQGLVSKNKEVTDISVKSMVFPNPTTEGVTFEFDKKTSADWHIVMYNAVGQITGSHRVSTPQGTATLKVNLDKTRPNGTYLYNILDENSLIRANGQFVKN